MSDPAALEERITVNRTTTSCSVKVTRKSAEGDFTSVETMNSMTVDVEMSPIDTERLLYRLSEHVARKCYVDLHVHEAITRTELTAAIERIQAQYRALGKPKDPAV